MKYVLIALFCLSSLAYANEWQTNIDHSEIHFKIPYMKVSEVTGRFRDFKASANIDENTLSHVKVSIEASSIDTGHRMRDNHLRGHDFFKTKEFSQINFVSSKVTKQSDSKFKIDGQLTIKDITRAVSFDVELTENLKDTWGYDNRFAKFSGQIDRKSFDMTWNKTLDQQEFLVGDTITISGVFQIQPGNKLTPNSKHMIPDTETIRNKDLERQGKDEPGFVRKIRKIINGK